MTDLKHNVFGNSNPSQAQKKEEPKEEPRVADLRSLIELGCVKDSVEIAGTTFVMRSLGEKEKLDISQILLNKETPDAKELFEFNIRVLASSIISANGVSLETMHPEPEGDPITKKMEILASMQSPVLGKLIEFYDEITKRCDEQYAAEEVKN